MKRILLLCFVIIQLISSSPEAIKLTQQPSLQNVKQLRHLQQVAESDTETQQNEDLKQNTASSSQDSSISFVSSRYHKLIDIPPTIDMDKETDTETQIQHNDEINSWIILGFIWLIWLGISLLALPFIYFSVQKSLNTRSSVGRNENAVERAVRQIELENVITEVRLVSQSKPKEVGQEKARKLSDEAISQQLKDVVKQEQRPRRNQVQEQEYCSKQLEIEEINKSTHLSSQQSNKHQQQEQEVDYFKEPKMSNLLQKDSYIIPSTSTPPKVTPSEQLVGQCFSFSQIRQKDELGREQNAEKINETQKLEADELSGIFKVKDSELSENNCEDINEMNNMIEKSIIKSFQNTEHGVEENVSSKKQFLKDKNDEFVGEKEENHINKSFEEFINSSKSNNKKQISADNGQQSQQQQISNNLQIQD